MLCFFLFLAKSRWLLDVDKGDGLGTKAFFAMILTSHPAFPAPITTTFFPGDCVCLEISKENQGM